jgi:hypothetical protein
MGNEFWQRTRFAQNRSAWCCNKRSSGFDRSDRSAHSAQALEQRPCSRPSKICCLRFHSAALFTA